MPVGSVGLMTRAFLLFKLKDDNYVVILEHKVPKVTVNCLEYLKWNGICVIMSYAFIWNRAVFYCRVAVSAGFLAEPLSDHGALSEAFKIRRVNMPSPAKNSYGMTWLTPAVNGPGKLALSK